MHNHNALSGGGDSLKPFRGAGVIASGCGAVAPVPLWAVKAQNAWAPSLGIIESFNNACVFPMVH